MCYISDFILIMLLSICVELTLYVLLVIDVLKSFVTPTLTYTAQVDESVIHFCFVMLLSICVDLALSVILVIRVLKCFVTLTLTYTAQAGESCYISVLNFTRLLSICVELAL